MEIPISERIRILRNHYKLNVINFAYGCGISNVTMFKMEKGGRVSERSLLKMIACYGTTKEWLLYGAGEMLPFGPTEVAYDKIDGEAHWIERACAEAEHRGTLMKKEIEKLCRMLHRSKERESRVLPEI